MMIIAVVRWVPSCQRQRKWSSLITMCCGDWAWNQGTYFSSGCSATHKNKLYRFVQETSGKHPIAPNFAEKHGSHFLKMFSLFPPIAWICNSCYRERESSLYVPFSSELGCANITGIAGCKTWSFENRSRRHLSPPLLEKATLSTLELNPKNVDTASLVHQTQSIRFSLVLSSSVVWSSESSVFSPSVCWSGGLSPSVCWSGGLSPSVCCSGGLLPSACWAGFSPSGFGSSVLSPSVFWLAFLSPSVFCSSFLSPSVLSPSSATSVLRYWCAWQRSFWERYNPILVKWDIKLTLIFFLGALRAPFSSFGSPVSQSWD